jgi:hypothetical protein
MLFLAGIILASAGSLSAQSRVTMAPKASKITFAAGPAAGSSPGIPTCSGTTVCNSFSGTISLVTGTSTTTGVLLSVTATWNAATEQTWFALTPPSCHGDVYLAAGPYTSIPVRLTYTLGDTTPVKTITINFNVGTAPTASTAYELQYVGCSVP